MNAQSAADDAERQRHLQLPHQILAVSPPHGERQSREHHCVDAVHDALVVSRGAVRIELGEARGGGDAVNDGAHLEVTGAPLGRCACWWRVDGSVRAATEGELRCMHATGRANSTSIAEVRQDAQAQGSAGNGGSRGTDGLGHAIHQVRAHRVPAIDQDVQDDRALP
jgi:hypothetical protein